MQLPDLYAAGIPIYLLFGLLEYAWLKRRRGEDYRYGEAARNIVLFATNSALGLAYGGLIFAVWHWLFAHRLFEIAITPLSFVLLFFAEDFVMYWNHRLQHRVRYLWASSHVVHHSSRDYNLFTALRNGWLKPLGGLWLLWGLLCFVGFPPALVIFQAGVSRIYQFFTHTRTIDRCPRVIEYLLVTPSHHRVHHACNAIYIDKNYGGILIIWDRMFGSFQEELVAEPCRYGVLSPVNDRSLFDVNFRAMLDLWHDLRTATSLRERCAMLLLAPGRGRGDG